LRLLRAAHVFAPAELGAQDILIGGGRILAVGGDLSVAGALDGLIAMEILPPGRLIPGLIDQHVHFIGGGEGDGPDAACLKSPSRPSPPPVSPRRSACSTKIEAKTLPLLLRKAHELDRAGLTTFIYTGAMALPAPFLTQSVRSDIMLLDTVIGAKSAIADRAFPNLDFAAFATLAGSLVQAKAMSGKAALLHLHVGRLVNGLATLFDLVEKIDFPPSQAVPTHVNRAPEVSPFSSRASASRNPAAPSILPAVSVRATACPRVSIRSRPSCGRSISASRPNGSRCLPMQGWRSLMAVAVFAPSRPRSCSAICCD
jgi:beta-aspartyl-dipeptidase (metallo-type)